MTWKFLAEIKTSTEWTLTPLTAGQLFRVRSTTDSLKPDYLRAAFVQVVDESKNNFTFFETRRIGFKQETEAFLFVLPESLPARKLAIKRLDDSDKAWTIQIEELVGEINLPIHVQDITGLPEALAGKANASHAHSIEDIADFPEIPIWYPERFTHCHQDSTVISGGAINNGISANQQFNLQSFQNPGSSSDSFKFRAFLASGSYVLKILGIQDTASGILAISVNGQLLSETLDWYQSRLVHNVLKSITVSFPDSGWQEFLFSVNGKNAASSGYKAALTKFDLFKV